jgi:aspartate aminotransferase
MTKVSRLATELRGSDILKIATLVNEMKAKGQQIANLTIGDLDSNIYPIPTELKEHIKDAYDLNLTNYPPADGLLNLRNEISKELKEFYGLSYANNEITVSGGSRPIIFAIFMALVDKGDKIVCPVPSWNNNHYACMADAQMEIIETLPENNFMPVASQLKDKLKGATLLTLCSPLNPTGTMFTEAQLREICQLVIEENNSRPEGEKKLYIMYDQIYSKLTFAGKHVDPVSLFPELRDYTVYIDGISKCLAATGVRVGWGFGPKFIIDKMKAILAHAGAWAPKPEQHATAKYMETPELLHGFIADFKVDVKNSLNVLYQGIQALKDEGFAVDAIEPMGALYLTLNINYIGYTTPEGKVLADSNDLVFYLIEHASTALVPFAAFGATATYPWFRASVGACSAEDIQAVLPKLKTALQALTK